VGLKFGGGDSGEEEGVCLGADTRATGGPIVADKNCEKVSTSLYAIIVSIRGTAFSSTEADFLTRSTTSHPKYVVVVLELQPIPSELPAIFIALHS
jgi:20S proteasome subunit beta 2